MQVSTEDTDLSRSPASTVCIQSQAASHSLPLSSEALNETIPAFDSAGSSSGLKIPWTITNRYYSALVHFAAHTMHGLSPHEFRNIPAVLFVWLQGESYKHHISRIAQDLSGCQPEVCLAVRIPSQTPDIVSLASDEGEEDDTEIDGFLSSHGFEYIDAAEERQSQKTQSNSWSEGVPGLPRVVDALSTIMWPSMQPRTKDTTSSTKTRERERALLDWAHSSQDSSLSAVEEVVASSSSQISERTRSMKHEMQELARWLEEDESLREDPWKSAASSGAMSTSPTAAEFDRETPRVEQTEAVAQGFDDDFTVFVSAPAVDPADTSGRSTPDASAGGLSATSAHHHAGDLYRSLGSVSDFGGSEDGNEADNADSEDDMPTREEILATSSRIFGSAKFPTPPDMESRTATAKPPKALTPDETPSLSEASPKAMSDSELEGLATEGSPGDGGGSYDMDPFDLSKVLGALQEMKAEIASMEDEGERRRAAAKVALGLVYGLEADAQQ
ncbi:putative alpha and gamma adaptin binding protein p34 [Lyophyllum shimeji]|uniref:Alpha and gamma adaptin binding protein p34 n=1 Tax=Lyophyllum shimeji TaxID=47721 RepID=A0A9P3UM72_LYOSH|nr:putative alpha and gamma adaptin binding protein p34 [Lyophyllum shimeji]